MIARPPHPCSGTLVIACMALLADPAPAQAPLPCGSARHRELAIQRDPRIPQHEARLEQFTRDFLSDLAQYRDGDTMVYVIPMVFHVLHDEGPENISDEQILDAVAVLNRDLRKLNADTALLVWGFDTLATDARVEFRLATIDNTGQCTNGIQRIRTVETHVGDDGSKLYPWAVSRYLNVWTAADMQDGVAGYAYYPSAVNGLLALADGVMIRHDYVGRIGTSSETNSRALTHEVGHWLNLQHTWGSTNVPGVSCGDDLVEDTPVTQGSTTCDLNLMECDSGVHENVQNYMDYSFCPAMFTHGQGDRMHAALNSPDGHRSQFWSAANQAQTGIDGITNMACAPRADLYAEDRWICAGSSTSFRDNSQGATPTSWLWEFQDGDPATSVDSHPTVTFNTPGKKTVTLTVSNAQGSTTRVVQDALLVAPGWPETGSWSADLEPLDALDNWIVNNIEGNPSKWARITGVGHGGTGVVGLNAYDQYGPNDLIIDDGANDIDELITPTMDLEYGSGLALDFWYASATRATDLGLITDKLEVLISTDCGRTWAPRATIEGLDLLNNGASASPYLTSPGTVWTQRSVPIPDAFATANVRIMFRFISSAFANNLYLDDIQITGNVGLDEAAGGHALFITPNPANGVFTVHPTTDLGNATLRLLVEDARGRDMLDRTIPPHSGGIDLDARTLGMSPGLYVVRLLSTHGSAVGRLAIE